MDIVGAKPACLHAVSQCIEFKRYAPPPRGSIARFPSLSSVTRGCVLSAPSAPRAALPQWFQAHPSTPDGESSAFLPALPPIQ
eukprot:350941-Chlamydomonas_euryale.AAC.10